MNQRLCAAAAALALCSAVVGCAVRSGDLRAIAGSISNLQGSGLVLQLNAGNDLAVAAGATSFAFSEQVAEGSVYYVTVLTQPSSPAQTCTVSNGSGNAGDSNISTVAVACVSASSDGGAADAGVSDAGTGDAGVDAGGDAGAVDAGAASYFLSVAVSGLSGSGFRLALTDSDAGTESLAVTLDGGSVGTFDTKFSAGDNYEVVVATQPSNPTQTCAFAGVLADGGSYTLLDDGIYGAIVKDTTLVASCATNTYSIGGTVSGLTGSGLVLTLTDTTASSSSALAVASGASSFAFSSTIASGHAYSVAVTTQPTSPSQTCSVTTGTGTVTSASIGSVDVSCVTNTGTVTTTVTNSTGASLSVRLSLSGDAGSGTVSVNSSSSGSYNFASVPYGTYTLTPSGAGSNQIFSPTSASVTASASTAYQSFTVGCAANYIACSSGCCPKVIAISAGYAHTCAVLYSGAIKCWGGNTFGQLGDNSYTNRYIPTSISDSASYSSVATGEWHTCGITSDAGIVRCWGYNNKGQLGDNTTVSHIVPAATADSTSSYSRVSAGGYHTCGVVTDAGTVNCWGYNNRGQLGDGTTTTDHYIPTAASYPDAYDQYPFSSVFAGDEHTCGLAIVAARSGVIVECWGYNYYGQLGNGSTVDSDCPVIVGSSAFYSAVAAGGTHACGITFDGGVNCWGYNYYGQLGNNSTSNSLTPTATSDLTTSYSAVAVGYYHSCGITVDGGVRCWGYNYDGELGNNSTSNSLTPIATADSATSYSAIAVGYYHTCGITFDGGVKCWGFNSYGQLGNNTVAHQLVPVDVQF